MQKRVNRLKWWDQTCCLNIVVNQSLARKEKLPEIQIPHIIRLGEKDNMPQSMMVLIRRWTLHNHSPQTTIVSWLMFNFSISTNPPVIFMRNLKSRKPLTQVFSSKINIASRRKNYKRRLLLSRNTSLFIRTLNLVVKMIFQLLKYPISLKNYQSKNQSYYQIPKATHIIQEKKII